MSGNSEQAYSLDDLLYLMSRLREPEYGCPWDLKQSFQSIAPSTIEEAYEVVDAIEKHDYVHLKEELGDLLFQVVFYGQLGKEAGHFDFSDITSVLTEKLIRRHPHVFPDGTLESRNLGDDMNEANIKSSWESIKQQERANKGSHGLLDDVPVGLPALNRAAKLQKRASRVGFDWNNAEGVLEKVREELDELQQTINGTEEHSNKNRQQEELGDLLFSVVNLSRHLKIDPETAMRAANKKFVNRFEYIENKFAELDRSLSKESLDLMEKFWQEAKNQRV